MVGASPQAVSELVSQERISGQRAEGRVRGERERVFTRFSFWAENLNVGPDPSLLILDENSHLLHLFLLKKASDTWGTCNIHKPTTLT